MDKREYLLDMINELVSIPSVTESSCESEPGEWVRGRLAKIKYFKDNPDNMKWIETPLEGSREKLHSLIVRIDSAAKTNRTILLMSHYDVVDVDVYGEHADLAFDMAGLNEAYNNSGDDVLYGRGVMDMKCSIAIEVDILEEFANDRSMFDVNIIASFVGDEENSSAGMRGVLPALAAMKAEGLDFLTAVNMEPGEAGDSGEPGPRVFLGTLGKLMPSFYVRGCAAHVGNCYTGFSSALAAANIITAAECSSELADPLHGKCQPSWICLDMDVMRAVYSVTVPDRAYVYFNCFTTTNAPADLVRQTRAVAASAFSKTSEHLSVSCKGLIAKGYDGAEFSPYPPKIFTLDELIKRAADNCGAEFEKNLDAFMRSLPSDDMRRRGIKIVDHIADLSGEEGPYIVCFFLPPWLPVRTDFTDDGRDAAVVGAVREIEEELEREHGIKITEVEFFAGLCDLSYVGAKVSAEDLSDFKRNMPGWGCVYSIPLEEMNSLGMPVVNMGPSGEDAHKKTERLYLHYSLDILPDAVRSLIRKLSERL